MRAVRAVGRAVRAVARAVGITVLVVAVVVVNLAWMAGLVWLFGPGLASFIF